MATPQIGRMAATVTQPQKDQIKHLLELGRWNNESEIVRYGIELVRREVEQESRESMSPLADDDLAAAYAAMSAEEIAEDQAMAAASMDAQKGERA